MSDIDAHQLGVLLEHSADQNKAVLESVGDIQQKVARLEGIESDVAELKQDMKVVKAAVMDVSRDLAEHKSLPAHLAHGHA